MEMISEIEEPPEPQSSPIAGDNSLKNGGILTIDISSSSSTRTIDIISRPTPQLRKICVESGSDLKVPEFLERNVDESINSTVLSSENNGPIRYVVHDVENPTHSMENQQQIQSSLGHASSDTHEEHKRSNKVSKLRKKFEVLNVLFILEQIFLHIYSLLSIILSLHVLNMDVKNIIRSL